jgi:hypothetical protein
MVVCNLYFLKDANGYFELSTYCIIWFHCYETPAKLKVTIFNFSEQDSSFAERKKLILFPVVA